MTAIDSEPEIVDADVVHPAEHATLVHQPRRSEVLKPLDVADQREAMDLYQRGLREILAAEDWQDAGRGEKFVKKSGWRKIAAWFDLSIELVRDQVERDENGDVWRASVWARALAPSGRFADGDGYCDASERRFNDPRGRQKLENDLRGTAATRAVNRAISNLVGMGAVSAEEMSGGEPHGSALPFGPSYDKEIGERAGHACVKLAGGDPQSGVALWKLIQSKLGGYMPHAVAVALITVAAAENLVPDVEAPEPS